MSLITLLDYIGIIAFSISGATKAIKLKLDYFGIFTLAAVTAIGGGVVRDLVIKKDALPTFFLTWEYPVLIAITTAIMIAVKGKIKYGFFLEIVDALGLATFTVEAGLTASDMKLNFVTFVFVSLITAVGGGIIRDIMANEIPGVLNKDVYASAAIFGSVILWYSLQIMPRTIASYLCIALTFAVRIMAIVFNMGLPTVDYQEEA